METTQHNNETQITEKHWFQIEDELEIKFNDILKSFGKELQEIETEINQDKQKRSNRIQSIKQVLATASLLCFAFSFSSLSAKDLCSKKGPDELLRSSTYSGKFFFKYDCKKRKTYFSEEQARVVNDKLKIEREKEITITVRMANDENLIITANHKGIVKTGFRMSWSKETLWDKDQKRLSQLGLAKWN